MNIGLFGLPKRANPPGLLYLGKRSMRGTSIVNFAKEFSPDIDEYEFVIDNLVQSVGAASANVFMRLSTDKGGSFDASSIYTYAAFTWTPSAQAAFGSNASSAFFLGAPDNDAGYGLCTSGTIFVNNRGLYTQIVHQNFARDQNRGANDPQGSVISGVYMNTKRVNGMQVWVTGGSTAFAVSGEIRLYGYHKG